MGRLDQRLQIDTMTHKVFEIRGAPDNEVEDIRHLLHENKISYYETPRGNFGKSMAAIWVHDKKSYAKARELIDKYQKDLSLHNKLNSKRENSENKLHYKFGFYILAVFIFVIAIWRLFYEVSFF